MATSTTGLVSQRLSRDEYRKAKELEELRKTGAAPPELDEDGNMINPHIPQYISDAPWYLNQQKPGLKHQRATHFDKKRATTDSIDVWYKRGQQTVKPVDNAAASSTSATTSSAAPTATTTKYQPGACKNCGSLTHKTHDCLDRPRKRNAALLGKRLSTYDDVVDVNNGIDLSFEAKRDRWGGFDNKEYNRIIQQYELVEQARKRKKAEELEAEFGEAAKKQMLQQQEENGADGDRAAAATNGDAKSNDADNELDDARKLAKLRKQRKLAKLAKTKFGIKNDEQHTANAGDETKKHDDDMNESDASHSDADSDTDSDASDLNNSSDEDLRDYGELMQQRDDKTQHTVRNLRIREDTAKYLHNLNPNSAYYDPKTRSMRENPYANKLRGKSDVDAPFVGDNFIKASGETKRIQDLQQFAWDAAEKHGNVEIHAQALPSAVEVMYNQYQQKKVELRRQKKKEIGEMYGVEQQDNDGDEKRENNNAAASATTSKATLQITDGDTIAPTTSSSTTTTTSTSVKPPPSIPASHLLAPAVESSAYVEYDADGRIIRTGSGADGVNVHGLSAVKSKYEEDVLEYGHTQIYGSYYDMTTGAWGYACCYQTVRRAYCTGESGRQAKLQIDESIKRRTEQLEEKQRQQQLVNGQTTTRKQKTQAELDAEAERKEAEIDAYARRQQREDDPMAAFKSSSSASKATTTTATDSIDVS